jgi:septal ring factor EnvC (AmiA/AmiB activator)
MGDSNPKCQQEKKTLTYSYPKFYIRSVMKWDMGSLMSSKNELYKAINYCLKPVKEDLANIDKRAKEISNQLNQIESRVKALSNQLANIEEAVKTKSKV